MISAGDSRQHIRVTRPPIKGPEGDAKEGGRTARVGFKLRRTISQLLYANKEKES
jgi:hypothetical protein